MNYSSYRIDDYYTKIKVQKLYARYTEEMVENSINKAMIQ